MSAPICFVDTETDGVHPDRKVWEVAMIRRDERPDRSVRFFVEIDLSTADPFGLRVGGFYDRHPLGRHIAGLPGPTVVSQYDQEALSVPGRPVLSQADAALCVAEWTHGAHLVGAVPNFDAEVLSKLLRDNGLTPSWHYHLIDVEALAVGYLAAKGERVDLPWSSDNTSRACGVEPPSDRHTAMGDTDWARRLYDAITGGAS